MRSVLGRQWCEQGALQLGGAGNDLQQHNIAGARQQHLFFFQAEDGIRVKLVTGVQTCALPISLLTVLTDAGFAGKQRVIALRGLMSYVIGALQAEHLGPLSGAGTTVLAQLPQSEYPLLAETARYARQVVADE